MAEKKMWIEQELTCKPLDSIDDILKFLQDPPPWKSLCVSLKPHSDNAVRNIEINPKFGEIFLETPQTFCHYDTERPELESDVCRHPRQKLPQTLVCHDMANGYHDDCFIDGTGNYDAYTFYNWGGIDIFCYFSHHLITIPPLAWINVGHAHGVKVIGTVITEWADGVAFWDKVLSSNQESTNFANALVIIAKTLKFDGWLLNIENKIAKPNELLDFVRYLHACLHQELEHAVLIWYDSVTIEGNLTWQNGLTEKNKAFFDVVDGFFTNYSWTENNVVSSVSLAGDRLNDLFIGLDVWGRNFYGGGQFNTQEAIQVAHDYGCSVAIFAPAWTHEALCEHKDDAECVINSDDLSKYEQFLLRDRALWDSIWPFLNTNLPCALPFQTSFCRGQGKKRRLYGEVMSPSSWYNLRHMQYQPNSSHGPHGYLLSTQETIKKISDQGMLKDKTGITRYRRSLEEYKQKILSEKSLEQINLQSDQNDQQNIDTNELDSQKQPLHSKTKIKSYFRQLFRIKTSNSRIDESETTNDCECLPESSNSAAVSNNSVAITSDSAAVTSDTVAVTSNSAAVPSKPKFTGQSMIRVSVHLRLGQSVKTRYSLAYVPDELECLEPFYEDCFTGGSCLKINPSDELCKEHRMARLFHCDFYCEYSLIACVATKTVLGHETQYLNMKLFVTDSNGKNIKVVLVGHNVPHLKPAGVGSDTVYIYSSNSSSPSDSSFRDLQRYILLNDAGFYTPVENSFGWKVRYYEINLPGARVTSINCRTGLIEGPILLGYFGLSSRKEEDCLS